MPGYNRSSAADKQGAMAGEGEGTSSTGQNPARGRLLIVLPLRTRLPTKLAVRAARAAVSRLADGA